MHAWLVVLLAYQRQVAKVALGANALPSFIHGVAKIGSVEKHVDDAHQKTVGFYFHAVILSNPRRAWGLVLKCASRTVYLDRSRDFAVLDWPSVASLAILSMSGRLYEQQS